VSMAPSELSFGSARICAELIFSRAHQSVTLELQWFSKRGLPDVARYKISHPKEQLHLRQVAR
jgi:hypothetical protein